MFNPNKICDEYLFSHNLILGKVKPNQKNPKIPHNNYSEGSFATVFQALHKKTKITRAIKIIDKGVKNL